MKDTLIKLLKVYGATGRETLVREEIARMVKPHVDSVEVDALGNLICVKKASGGGAAGKCVMVAAHMDQIGFVVSDIDDKGFLRVHNVGGIRRANSINRRVVFESGLSGVLSCEERDNDPADKTMARMFIDIGCISKADAEAKVRRGDIAVYAPDVFEMGDMVVGPALDDRAACALLVEALLAAKNGPNEFVGVFTVQEEVGVRGATTAAYAVQPDVALALDLTIAGDAPKGPKFSMALGQGVAIKVMDSNLICTPWVVEKLEALAEKGNIPHQREVLTGGGTDGGAINISRGGVPTGVLSVPGRYIHSATETISMQDMDAALKLLLAFVGDAGL